MHWFKNCRTVIKLMLGFGLVGAIMAGIGYMGVSGMGEINHQIEIVHNHGLGLASLQEANTLLVALSRAARNAILDATYDDAAKVDRRIADMKKQDAEFTKAFEAYQKGIVLQANKERAAEIQKLYQ
jgi:methyl-accepting chemotaxis protein